MAGLDWLEPFKTSSAVVLLKNADNAIVWANEEYTRVTDLARDATLGKQLSAASALPDHARAAAVVKQVILLKRIHEETRSLTFDNVTRWFDCRHTPMAPEYTAGNGWCVLTNAIEITAQVQLQALAALLGVRTRKSRGGREGDGAFVRLLLKGATIKDLSTALQIPVNEVTGRLTRLAGTPLQ